MNRLMVDLRRLAVLMGFLVLVSGCGTVGKLLFPPVKGTWVDSAVEFAHCGVEQLARVTVSAVPAGEGLTTFTVTALMPGLGLDGLVERFMWTGEGSSGAHPSGGAMVSISGNSAVGSVTFMHACGDGGERETRLVTLPFSASRQS